MGEDETTKKAEASQDIPTSEPSTSTPPSQHERRPHGHRGHGHKHGSSNHNNGRKHDGRSQQQGSGRSNSNNAGRHTQRAPLPQEPASPMRVATDPNAYRSPGFQDLNHSEYKIDYAGLPKDEEDESQDATSQPQDNAAATQSQSPARTHHGPRGRKRFDRSGTDPNAYRSPGFPDDARKQNRGIKRGR